MADVRAFRAFRYDLGRVGALSDVVAPPYDVIDAGLQQELYNRSLYNVIRLELNKEEAGDGERSNRYTRAAGFLHEWTADGVLKQDSARTLYVCHQEYEVEGQTYTRKGFFARVGLEPFGSGRIYPHEQTLAGPKADRLSLYRATGMNLSPVFGLYPDEAGEVQAVLETICARQLPIEARDHLGVVSRIWTVTDQHAISTVTGLMGPKPIFIADGHHRYETGLKYLEERRATGDTIGDDTPSRFILMNLVGMSDPGLLILPTHRLVNGFSTAPTAEQLRQHLGSHFALETIGVGDEAARACWEAIESDGGQTVLGLGTADRTWLLARLTQPTAMDNLAPDRSPAWRELGVSVLHKLVLDDRLAPAHGGNATCKYVHLLREVTDAQAAGACQLAVLVPPAQMEHVTEIAGNLETMPPKSTYFYPKLLSGLVFHSLKVT